MSYTNTHNNHINDANKNFPIDIPWNTTFFNEPDGSLKSSVKISTEIMQDLRQHAKAISYNYFGTVPTFSDVDDTLIEEGDEIGFGLMNTTEGTPDAAGAALLDDMLEGNLQNLGGGAVPSGVSEGTIITTAKINEISAKLYAASQYNNYSNHTNYGYNRYADEYVNHVNSHSNSYRGNFCHRHHSNHTNNGGNTYNNYAKTHTNQAYTNAYHVNYANTL